VGPLSTSLSPRTLPASCGSQLGHRYQVLQEKGRKYSCRQSRLVHLIRAMPFV
jgi:hypothetical protein